MPFMSEALTSLSPSSWLRRLAKRCHVYRPMSSAQFSAKISCRHLTSARAFDTETMVRGLADMIFQYLSPL